MGRSRSAIAATMLTITALGASGCDPGTKSTTEQTPPALTWSVLNQETNDRQDVQGGATVNSGANDRFLITFKANDSGGVSRITLGGDISWSCTNGDLGQNRSALVKGQDVTLHENAQGQVETYTFLLTNVDPSGWDCSDGFGFAGGHATMRGSAENYSHKRSESTITISRSG